MVDAPTVRRKILFVKHELAYPRVSGHDVPCFELARSLRGLGHEVALATVLPLSQQSHADLNVPWFSLAGPTDNGSAPPRLSYWQERFRSYWGISTDVIQNVTRTAADFGAEVVIGVGLDAPPFIAGLQDRLRVWYAADEWVIHHLSLFRPTQRRTYPQLRAALIKGLYERSYSSSIDRALVVSSPEQRAMRRYAGIKNVDVVANGVDTEFFKPSAIVPEPHSAVFWGRLDFGPNLQALEWFCDRIWPLVRSRVPTATFTVMGFNAEPEVLAYGNRPGIEVKTDVPDIRSIVAANQIALLPMVSGGGIKNKLLEAAAMGKAIVCTTRSCGGLRSAPPAVVVDDEHAWADAIVALWQDSSARQDLERSARAWILQSHTWEAAAREVMRGIEESLGTVPD
jgi:glycosyltransferase involved in cell wall biosynthesis